MSRRSWRPTPGIAFGALLVGWVLAPIGLAAGLAAIGVSRGWSVGERAIVASLGLIALLIFAIYTIPVLDRGNQYCGLRLCLANSPLEIALASLAALLPLLVAGFLTRLAVATPR